MILLADEIMDDPGGVRVGSTSESDATAPSQVIMLQTLREEKKAAILTRWRELVLTTYPPDMAAFLRREKDRFANPVGYTINQGTEALLAWVLAGDKADTAAMANALEDLIKIRAVQDFSASQAVAFIFLLKQVIREELAGEEPSFDQLVEFDARVDRLTLAAFDAYMKNRERIWDLKVTAIKNRTNRILDRGDLTGQGSRRPANQDNGDGDASTLKGGADG